MKNRKEKRIEVILRSLVDADGCTVISIEERAILRKGLEKMAERELKVLDFAIDAVILHAGAPDEDE